VPDKQINKVARSLSITEKLKREVSLVSHFVADALCYFENTPDGAFLPEFHFREPGFLGYDRELENSAAWLFDVLHPDDFQELQRTIRKIVHGASSFGEIRLRGADGVFCRFRIAGKPVWPNDRNGYVAGGIIALNQAGEKQKEGSAPERETIIDTVLSNYVLIDREGVIISYSGAASNLLGQGGAGSIEGQSLFSFFVDVPSELRFFHVSNRYLEVDVELRRSGEEGRWLQVCIFPGERSGSADSHFVILRDISARKKSEAALAESEAKFRALADNFPGAMLILADGRVIYANGNAGSITGYEHGEILDESFCFSGLFVADSPGGFLADLEDGLKTSESVQREIAIRKKNGDTCHCLVSLKYMPFAGKKAVMAIINDISAIHQVNEKLDETRQRYWALFEATSDAIFLENISGTILDCNSACERLYGYSRNELVGMNAKEMVPADYVANLDELVKEVEKARVSGRHVCLEALGKHKNGSVFPTEVTINCVRLAGEECYAVTVRDISIRREIENARQRYESQLLQLQKLDNLGQMANGLANDFNNLLTGIMGYADLLLRDLPEPSNAREKARRIIDAGRKASEIIQQLMSYTGKMPSLFQKAGLVQMIREMEPALKSMCSGNLVMQFALEPVADINVDPPMLKQALMNIVKNACESIPDAVPGLVRIGLDIGRRDFLGHENGYFGPPLAAGQYVIVTVSDNGCGIDATHLNRIFDPFFSTKYSNRGLGLSSVLGMLRSHRGAVYIDSQPLQGTAFSILLPLDNIVGRNGGGSPEDAFPAGAVLVVDDEESVREILAVNLRELGYEAYMAEDGRKGLELFKRLNSRLSFAILDLAMPELNGHQLLREIRWLNPEIPVLICTGYLADSVRADLESLALQRSWKNLS
jgi:PAS domain S-box-containing protein